MKKGIFTVLICYTLWGVLPIFWKLFSGVNSLYVLSTRIVWSFVFCLIYMLITQRKNGLLELKKAISDKKTMLWMTGASVFIAINWGTYIWAVGSGHIVESSLGYFLNPIIVIIFSFIFFKEKLSVGEWISVAVAGAGVLFAIIRSGTMPYIALILAFSFAIYGVFKKKVNLKAEVSMVLEGVILLPLALTYIIVTEAMGKGSGGTFGVAGYLIFVSAGILTAIPMTLFSKAVKLIPLSLSGILNYMNPTLQFLIGVLIYKEGFNGNDIITFVFIWAAVIIFVVSSSLKHKRKHIGEEILLNKTN